ncbi:hypothetical protein [Methylophaga sulfidovorans]|uniref:Uncharacterized protein n=1 Tax=Methylophaga sulfidovorans TaxID=45496 RepID=A0A1I3VXU0_9GAMM|nr:hypothetical protein [Methylophaga sulfidovorans]SFJ99046.1 hypothetical protein SAMN04488079_103234 [Methylophaga sulfidovorans]
MSEELSLHAKLSTWLDKNGYPLEMLVASIARKHTQLSIRQGWYYIDSESGDSREIDIVCTAADGYGSAEINFVIECKATKGPWVIFSSEDALASYHKLASFALFSEKAYDAVIEQVFPRAMDIPEEYLDSKSIPWLHKTGMIGYSMAQALGGNKDVPYNASISCVKAATWLINNSLWSDNTQNRPFAISFPIIVTSSPLFECTLDENGKTILSEISHGYVFFKQHVKDSSPTCISIVTESHIETFMKECQSVANHLLEAMDDALVSHFREQYI